MELPVILIVDDYEDVIRTFKLWFRHKYAIVSAASIAEAQNILDSIQVDLLVVDHSLPDGQGYDLLSHSKSIPAIMMTGDRDSCINFGHLFTACFTKPHSFDKLEVAIDSLLGLET